MLQVLWFKMVQVSIFMSEKDMSGFSREQFPLKQEVVMLDMQSPTLQGLLLDESVFPMSLYIIKNNNFQAQDIPSLYTPYIKMHNPQGSHTYHYHLLLYSVVAMAVHLD